MTGRMSLICVATAAAALIVAGVAGARAAVGNCTVFPERCQYGGNGVNYFYPQGYRLPGQPGVKQRPVALRGGPWGCGASDGTNISRTWAYPTQASAAQYALKGCKATGRGTCRLIGCSASITTPDAARATWTGPHQ